MASLEAHKMIIALHSHYFRTAFYGSGIKFKEGREGVMIIKETTKEAFEDFLGFLYEKKIDFKAKTLEELYQILNLAERFQVGELKERTMEVFKNFSITVENVVEVAATTELFSHFETPSKSLYSSCVALMANFKTSGSLVQFIQSNEDKTTVMKLLNDIKTENCPNDEKKERCRNCQNDPCLDNFKVSLPLLKSHMVIRNICGREPGTKIFRVLAIRGGKVKIQRIDEGQYWEPVNTSRNLIEFNSAFACRAISSCQGSLYGHLKQLIKGILGRVWTQTPLEQEQDVLLFDDRYCSCSNEQCCACNHEDSCACVDDNGPTSSCDCHDIDDPFNQVCDLPKMSSDL